MLLINESVLCFEDHPEELLPAFTEIQKKLHLAITYVKNFEQARLCLERDAYRLFILDIEIEGDRATGLQLAEYIRRIPSYVKTPIIFISSYSHFTQRLLSKIHHCSFLSKPFSKDALLQQIGVALTIPQYLKKQYEPPKLLIPNLKGTFVEIDPQAISYIELVKDTLCIQYINDDRLLLKHQSGVLKNILTQIKSAHIDCLRQVYRSVIINVDQIQRVELKKTVANVWLFHDSSPKPIGVRYRKNVKEFIEGCESNEL